METENARLVQENQDLKAQLKILNDKVNRIMERLDPVVESDTKKEFRALLAEQEERGRHPMGESHERNREILDKFLAIFDKASDKDKQWLAKEPLVPPDMRFSNPIASRETARPLHSVFFLGDSDALKQLQPYLTRSDFETEGPYNSSFLHMIFSGIEHGAPQVNAPECAQILLSEAPSVREKRNQFGLKPEEYAFTLLHRYNGRDESKVSKIRAILDVMKTSK